MSKLDVEKARELANGDKPVTGFSGGVRSLENVALEVGDEFTFPDKYEVFEQKFGEYSAQYIWVILANGNAKKFYPSTFTKSRAVYNEDGTPTAVRKHTLGTAAEEFRNYRTIDDAMNALAGKRVKVTHIEIIRTIRYGTNQVVNTQIPTIDFVE